MEYRTMKDKITLKHTDTARDGGTKVYDGSDGKTYYKDYRIGTITRGKIYDGYPGHLASRIIDEDNFQIIERMK